jgi:hypothetical protein
MTYFKRLNEINDYEFENLKFKENFREYQPKGKICHHFRYDHTTILTAKILALTLVAIHIFTT